MRVNVRLTGDWAKALEILGKRRKRIQPALDSAVFAEAQLLKRAMVGNIDKGGLAPISPATRALRRLFGGSGGKPLKARGWMRSQILVTPLANGGAFVGILRRASAGAGRIAEIQEKGANIRVTDRMRRFLHAMLRKAGARKPPRGAAVVTIRIPPRPFITPIVQAYAANPEPLKRRIIERVRAALLA